MHWNCEEEDRSSHHHGHILSQPAVSPGPSFTCSFFPWVFCSPSGWYTSVLPRAISHQRNSYLIWYLQTSNQDVFWRGVQDGVQGSPEAFGWLRTFGIPEPSTQPSLQLNLVVVIRSCGCWHAVNHGGRQSDKPFFCRVSNIVCHV